MKRLFSLGLALSLLGMGMPQESEAGLLPIRYQSFKDQDQGQPLKVHLVEVNLNHPHVELGVAIAQNSKGTGENVRQLAERNSALAAVNGSFFHGRKLPSAVGVLMQNNELLADSGHRRTSLGITNKKDVIIGIPEINSGLYYPHQDRFQKVNGVNQPRQSRQTIVYTPHFGKYTHTNEWGREVVVRKNKVVRYSYGNTQIPKDGFVISAHGKTGEIRRLYPVGSEVKLNAQKFGRWKDVNTVMTGAPHLVHQGRIYNTYFQEHLPSDLKRPNARTAVGVTHNKKLLLVNVFPAKGSKIRGVTYTRLAQIMRRLGATEAMGLDGGSSTSLYVSNGLQHANRRVTNALIVRMKPNS